MGTLKLAHAAGESMGIHSGWVDQLKIPERPLRRDFIAQRGHAPGETRGWACQNSPTNSPAKARRHSFNQISTRSWI